MKKEDIDKIAEIIANKLGEQGGQELLGCGSASSSQAYRCTATGGYSCTGSSYDCGGNASFECRYDFECDNSFGCDSEMFTCHYYFGCHSYFNCSGGYEW